MNYNSFIINLFGWICIISWFAAIWIVQYRSELFWTGLFAVIVSLGHVEGK